MSSAPDEPPVSTFFPEGALLAGYRLLGARERGAMGLVYEAVEVASGRRVAVKVLRSRARRYAYTVAREREALTTLSHPNIVAYVGHGETAEGLPYLVTEWLEGESLEARLRRGRLAIDDALGIAIALGRALGAAHAARIVHRDVKPANILLCKDGAVKLLDFGVAHLVGKEPGALSIGTALYMAPEQARASATVDARADVYALGSVLFECLAGRPPFQGERTTVVLARAIFEPAPRLSSAGVADASPALEDAVARLLAKRPEERPADGDAAAALLERCRGASVSTARADAATRPDEQRIGCVALVELPEESDAKAGLGALAEEYGVDVDGLLEGTYLVTAPDVVPADQALRVARFALALVGGGARAALATGTVAAETSSAVERAEELLHRTPAGAARVCPATRSLLAGRARLDDDVLRPGGALVDTEADAAPEPIGRDALVRALLEAPSARILGEPGVGKTCIMHAIRRRLRARGRGVVVLRGEVHRTGSSLALFSGWLARRLRLGDVPADDAAVLAQALAPSALPGARGAGDDLPRALADLLVDDARARSAVVLVDDAQWLDAASARVLELVAARDVVVLAFARSEPELRLDLTPNALSLVVGPLDDVAARALADALEPELAPATRARVVERALGHPFVLRELLRAASEGHEGVPDSVLGVIQARLARLPEGVRRVARVAAVLGATPPFEAVRRLAGGGDVTRELEALVAASVLVRDPGDARALVFASPLLREAAYELSTEHDRVAAHAEAARWYDERPAREPALVAWHAERGRDLARAAGAYAESAARAVQMSDVALALEHARRGVACGADGATLAELRLAEADALTVSVGLAEGGVRAREARAFFTPGSARWAAAMYVSTRNAVRRGAVAELREHFDALVAAPSGDVDAARDVFRALCIIGVGLTYLGLREEAERVDPEVERRARDHVLDDLELAQWKTLVAIRAQHRGEWSLVIEGHGEASEIYARAGQRLFASLARMNVGSAHGEVGELDVAIDLLADVIRDGTRRDPNVLGYASFCRGRALRRAGRPDEAERELTRALARADADARMRAHTQFELARVALLRGDLDEAGERAELLIELTAAEMPLTHAASLALAAEVALLDGDHARALEISARATTLMRASLPAGEDASYVSCVRLDVLAAAAPQAAADAEVRRVHAELLARAAVVGAAPRRRAFLAIVENVRILAHAARLGLDA